MYKCTGHKELVPRDGKRGRMAKECCTCASKHRESKPSEKV